MGKASVLLVHCPNCKKQIGVNADICHYCGFSMKEYRNKLFEEERNRKIGRVKKIETKENDPHITQYSRKVKNPVIATRLSPMMSTISAIAALAVCVALLAWINSFGFSLIRAVKGGHPYAYPNITYEEAFNDFFANPHWENASNGRNKIVRFTGECGYKDDKTASVILNFEINDDNTFELRDGKVNGVSLNILELDQINSKPFEDYKK